MSDKTKDPVVEIQQLPYMGKPKDTQREKEERDYAKTMPVTSGGKVTPKAPPHLKKGGKVSSASSRGDGIAQRGKTRGKMIMCGGGMVKGKK
jgi:hypothetical protein